MIHLFSHYVPGRLIILATVEAMVLLIAASVVISLHLAGSGTAISGATEAISSQAGAFALGMMIVMSSMGLYQSGLSEKKEPVGVRLTAAFAIGFAGTALVSYLVPSLNPGLFGIAGASAVA